MKAKSVLLIALFWLHFFSINAQQHKTANNSVPIHTSIFSYGINPGYYSPAWTDQKLSEIAAWAGVHSSRLSLPDEFLEQQGYKTRTKEFAYYTNQLKFNDLTVFIGSASLKNRDTQIYPGCAETSKAFKGIYKPVWIEGKNKTFRINPENTLAAYIYTIYVNYGKYITYWEVFNEPDFTNNWVVASKKDVTDSWWLMPPNPKDLPNLNCPIYSYVRMLRVTYEVIKRLNNKELITTGGIGYPSFLKQLLNVTDNPDQGKVSSEYPFKAGAYFDVLSFHDYPFYYLSTWDSLTGKKIYNRHSDAAAEEFITKKNLYEQMLIENGYDGKLYPRKYVICTEVNIPARQYPHTDDIGSEEAQKNFTIKSLVLAQKNKIRQLYYFVLGRSADPDQSNDPYQLMGLYYNLKTNLPGKQVLTSQGVAFKTTSLLLYGYTFNERLTNKMNLPTNVSGTAFTKKNNVVFVLWAKSSKDLSEINTISYQTHVLMDNKALIVHEWNYSVTLKTKILDGSSIKLTPCPIFITTK